MSLRLMPAYILERNVTTPASATKSSDRERDVALTIDLGDYYGIVPRTDGGLAIEHDALVLLDVDRAAHVGMQVALLKDRRPDRLLDPLGVEDDGIRRPVPQAGRQGDERHHGGTSEEDRHKRHNAHAGPHRANI